MVIIIQFSLPFILAVKNKVFRCVRVCECVPLPSLFSIQQKCADLKFKKSGKYKRETRTCYFSKILKVQS